MSATAECAGCANALVLAEDCVAAVCPSCHTCNVVAAGKSEGRGAVAALRDEGALANRTRGTWKGCDFAITGAARLTSGQGVWTEYAIVFSDGRWAVLSDSQGRYHLLFPEPAARVPSVSALRVGLPVAELPGQSHFVVVERGASRIAAARGAFPYVVDPRVATPFADLSGAAGELATLDYGDPAPLLFVGDEVALDELHLGPAAVSPPDGDTRCPACGEPVHRRVIARTVRLTCPHCRAVLDVEGAQLVATPALPSSGSHTLALGAAGSLEGLRYQVVGWMRRSCSVDGDVYTWDEHLLDHDGAGYRWLLESDGHWTFVTPVAAGEIGGAAEQATGLPQTVRFRDQGFRPYDQSIATVEAFAGEFYWKVHSGAQAQVVDYIHPPELLSREISSGEELWSHGTWLEPAVVERAFGVKLPAPTGVAPHQPFKERGIYRWWALLLAASALVAALVWLTRERHVVVDQTFELAAEAPPDPNAPAPVEAAPATAQFTAPFALAAHQNLEVRAYSADADNTWVYVSGDFYDEASGRTQEFDVPLEYYHGVSGGEAWSEGTNDKSIYVRALPAGTYTLRIEAQRERTARAAAVRIRVTQGVPRPLHLLVLLALLSLIPTGVLLSHYLFERRRWQGAAYAPGWTKSQ